MLTHIDFNSTIAQYERRFLEKVTPSSPALNFEIDGLEFIKVNGLAKYWQSDSKHNELQERFSEITTSATGFQKNISFLIIGKNGKVELYYAIDSALTCGSLLHGSLPGVSIEKDLSTQSLVKYKNLGGQLQNWVRCIGLISGIPSGKSINEEIRISGRYERIVRSLRGANWYISIKAYPIDNGKLETERNNTFEQISQISSNIKAQYQQSNQISTPVTNRSSQVQSESFSGERFNKKAEYLVELLERSLQRQNSMIRTGQWLTAVTFGSDEISTTRRLANLLRGSFTGDDSRPDPIRVHYCSNQPSASPPNEFATYLSSEELAIWLCPLQEEVVGFEIYDPISLDLNSAPVNKHSVGLGQILWNNSPTGYKYEIDIEDLARHGVVFGITGSGKTTTVMQLVTNCWHNSRKVPFLIIEPAKTEYRGLTGKILNNQQIGIIPELRVFTFGNEQVAPFRINPFEFELTDDPEQSLLLSHIDFLKAAFNAAFILYAPMPYILDISLHEVYEDKGWNLASGKNMRIPSELWSDRDKYPIFPTLGDLYKKIEEVTTRFNYGPQIEKDVIAALKVRIGGLRIGSKGMMLDIARGYPMKELLNQPAVIEIESIGNDEEKSFLIGLLLARIYEYRRLQDNIQPNILSHVLVIEEAHRLLKKVNTQVGAEEANLRAQAIETFSNMLSEIRHYGQGVIVSEQIPTKLSDDVIRNTNLKIIHRLLAKDDRELVAATINLDEKQSRVLTVLKRGEAVVYSENDDHPCLVKMDNFRNLNKYNSLSNQEIRSLAKQHINLAPYHSITDFQKYGVTLGWFGALDPVLYRRANQFSERENHTLYWGMLLLRLVHSKNTFGKLISNIEQQFIAAFGQKTISETLDALKIYFILGAQNAIAHHCASRHLGYLMEDELRKLLSMIITSTISPQSRNLVIAEQEEYKDKYQANLKQPSGPYPGCKFCGNKCAYLMDSLYCLSESDINYFQSILEKDDGQNSLYAEIRSLTRGMVQNWLDNEIPEVDDIAYCVALSLANRIKMDVFAQEKYANYIHQSFHGRQKP